MLKYKISKDDFLAAQKLCMGSRLWLSIFGVLLVFGIMAVRGNIASDGSFNRLASVVPFIVVCVLLILIGAFGVRRKVDRLYRENKAVQDEIMLDFDDEEIRRSSTRWHFVLPWQDIYKFKEGDQFIVIYQTSRTIHIVPKRAFPDKSLTDQFLNLLRSKACSQTRSAKASSTIA
jgi:hypothetical protein